MEQVFLEPNNQSPPKVSIVVPVYNGEKYIERCMSALLAQTLKEIEIILVDNGSEDSSRQIIQSYAQKFSNIVHPIFLNENARPAGARNAGIDHAMGDYIAFVDVDDTMEPNMYELLYTRAFSTDADITICAYVEFDMLSAPVKKVNRCLWNYSDPLTVPIAGSIYEFPYILHLVTPSIWNRITRRKIIVENSLRFIAIHSEDMYFAFETALYAKRINLVNYPLYHYYVYSSSAMFQKGAHYGPEYTKLCNSLLDLYERKTGPNSIAVQLLSQKLWIGLYRRRIFEMVFIDDYDTQREIIDSYFDVWPKRFPNWKESLLLVAPAGMKQRMWAKLIASRRVMYLYISMPLKVRQLLASMVRKGLLVYEKRYFLKKVKDYLRKGSWPSFLSQYAKQVNSLNLDQNMILLCPSRLDPQECRYPFEEILKQLYLRNKNLQVFLCCDKNYHQRSLFLFDYSTFEWVESGSIRQTDLLARAKYIIHDGFLPYYYVKKEGQVIIRAEMVAPYISYKDTHTEADAKHWYSSVLACDILITQDLNSRKFLEKTSIQFNGLHIIAPKIIQNAMLRNVDKKAYGWEGKRIIGFVPAWRSDMRHPYYVRQYERRFEEILQKIGNSLGDNDIIVPFFPINLWFSIIEKNISHVQLHFDYMDELTYLQLCDCLISDYSPYMHYFSLTGKPIIVYRNSNMGDCLLPKPAYDIDDSVAVAESLDELTCLIKLPPLSQELQRHFKRVSNDSNTGAKVAEIILNSTNFSCLQYRIYDIVILPSFDDIEAAPSFESLVGQGRNDTIFIIWQHFYSHLTLHFVSQHPEIHFTVCPFNNFPRTLKERAFHFLFRKYGWFAAAEQKFVRRFLHWALPGLPIRSFYDHTKNLGQIEPHGDK